MGADDKKIDAQMAADSATYDNPAPVEPPKKPSFVSSVRERLQTLAADSKAKFDQHQKEESIKREQYNAERAEIKAAEKEAALRGEKERRIKTAYEKEVNRKPFLQNAISAGQRIGGAVKRIGGAADTLTSKMQTSSQKPRPQMFGGMGAIQPSYGGQSREPNYGAAVGHSFGGGVPLFAPPQRQQRMGKSKASLNMVPLMPYTSGGRILRGRAGKQPPAFSPNFGLGKVGKMPSLFGPMKGKRKGGWNF